jgi:soluble lytic murein transglycosylase-like protein
LKQKAVLLALAFGAGAAGLGALHQINAQATANYAAIISSASYLAALQHSIEIVPRKLEAAVLPPAPPKPRPVVKIYPDTPPEYLARNYVETDTSRYNRHIKHAARQTKVSAALIRAVIVAESSFNPYALSSTGAVGLMQLMPDTAARYGVKNRMDPSQNILGGARYLSDLLRLFNNNMQLAIAAYNAGEGAVLKYGRKIPPYPETVAYVPKVLKYYKHYHRYA